MMLLVLALTLSTDPAIIHEEVRQLCPPMAAILAVHRDAGPACVRRWTAHQQRHMNTPLQELSHTLKRLINEMKERQRPDA